MEEALPETKKTRDRSPEYPTLDLPSALERAQQLYDNEGFNWAYVNVVIGHWGYREGSSSGMRAMAALRHYGLVEYQGEKRLRKVRLTGLAKRILRDPRPESKEREAAVREAALTPTIYKKVWDEWGQDLPSESQMAYDLEHSYSFNPNSIAGFIANYKGTLHFAGIDEQEHGGDIGEDSKPSSGAGVADIPPGAGMPGDSDPKQVKMQPLTIPLRRDGTTAILNAPNPLTKKDIANLKAWLKWYEDSMMDDEDDAQV